MGPFDYIVVGAGSSGCVLAERLSRNAANKVLVIESGPVDSSPLIDMPRGFGRTLTDSKLTHVYVAKKTGGHNEPEPWVPGQTPGGSASLKGMVYVPRQPRAHDRDRRQHVEWGKRCVVRVD